MPVGTYVVSETAAPEGYTKSSATCTITVDAAHPSGTPACSFSNPPIPPAISVVKTAGTSQASQAADGATLTVEAFTLPNVTYKYVVTNTGNVRLVNVTVVDDNGTPGNTADDFQAACEGAATVQPFQLAPAASATCYAVRSVTQATTNIVTAAGQSVGEGTPVSDTDDAKVAIVGPAITIIKTAGASAGSQAANGATYTTEAFPANVTYKYVVTNTGTTVLDTIAITDNKLGAITCPATTLAPSASMTCTATTSVAADTMNVATASGASPAGQSVDANDAAAVEILTPSISVVKTAGAAADGATLYITGGPVTYAYLVTNTGEVDLAGVTVVDDRGTASPADDVTISDCSKGGVAQAAPFSLAIGASMTCSATITVSVDTTNIATASGATPHATVTDTDDAIVLIRRVSIVKTNNTTGPVAPGTTVGYELTLSVTNGPLASITVKDVLPASFGTPSAISDGGTYDAPTRTITWNLSNVANGEKLTYNVAIAATTQGGLYVNTATITEGPCVAGDCDDDSTVPVWRVAILKANDAEGSLVAGDAVVYTLTFAVQNGPIASMVVTDTLPPEVVNPSNFSVAPASVVGRVITWNLANVVDGAKITYTATIAAGTAPGSYTNVAVITQGPCVAGECDDDSTVTVRTPILTISKAVTGNTDGVQDVPLIPDDDGGPAPRAKIGDTLTFTLTYTLANGPVTNAVITDVLPQGYGAPTAISDGGTYAAATRTITWSWASLAASGSVTYKVVVLAGADELAQPLVNLATIDSDDTPADDDIQPVVVAGPVQQATATPRVTPPPTDAQSNPAGDASGNVLLVLLAIVGLVAVLGVLSPAPARARRRRAAAPPPPPGPPPPGTGVRRS